MRWFFKYLQWGCAPKPATEPMGFRGSCVKLFRKTFRSVFSNSFFLCACGPRRASNSGLRGGRFGPPGGSWALLGGPWAPRSIFERFWAPFGPPFGIQNRPWNAPRATSRPILPSWRVPGRVPEGLWEVILGTFWRLGWRERKKGTKSAKNTQIFEAFVACVFLSLPCVFCAPRRSPS